ncbi:2-C-methyl-D-erythritol 4-phosphate cytidylyltransferase [Mesocricetibacter intestinalis]|uniref:2-C-methyl-D-erythritol 4-phosphate cytidylyltransferase n=1 Tax=Mesocricetibacter intestinalis TaxID=1521930 RepID=A0A4R6VAD6_9PAST|nr:2-C-methyl-D-erythritol 4-phosphate cytidylyltransferase [Mesocricetibacter intestinalis]TDQ56665.1 2-C-methyl-D-erythritol 4-phosphate cytidylyltransferase [Mesocricetibacter intestinalis]
MASVSPRKIIAVVPAAGIGSRMRADRPKQYLRLNGKTVLEHTLNLLLAYPQIESVILGIASGDPYLSRLPLHDNPRILVVEGGRTRAQTVLNCLKKVDDAQAWVMVHDAARPCLTHADLDKLCRIKDDNGAILAIPATDTIKLADGQGQILRTEDRSRLWQAQTPQFFPGGLLRSALEQAALQGLEVTDEASAMELAGYRPHLVAGRGDNLKITRPEDLDLAEFYLSKRQKEVL